MRKVYELSTLNIDWSQGRGQEGYKWRAVKEFQIFRVVIERGRF